MYSKLFVLGAVGLANAVAIPEPTAAPDAALVARAGTITNLSQLNSSLNALSKGPATSFAAGYAALMSAIQPSPSPSNTASAMSQIAAVYSAFPSNPLAVGADLLLAGVADQSSFGNFIDDVNDFGACNGYANNNPPPPQPVYPKKGANDAPYDVSEASLRSAIYFPPGFTYGKVKPAIFVPGTGVEACEAFSPNLGKLFTGSNYADPVYVNVPQNLLPDLQTSAEYVAYAVNYISAVSKNSNVTVLTWSGGAVASQWAFKYWPSTRQVTSDLIAISADYHGTVEVPLICPPGFPCDPSVLQQNYNSNFINKLRSNGGDSAFVPTTSIHSIFDEIVEPQQDPIASGDLNSANGVPSTNVQIQSVCPPGTPAGGPNFGHESSLYNPVTFAVAMDAIKNSGSANIARSGASSTCGQYFSTGLTLADVFATEALIPLAGFNIETYQPKTTTEPPIKSYAA